MKKTVKYILIAVALTLSWGTASADAPTGLFLLVPQGARAEAMGQSVVSNCLDYTALYWNPAAAAFVHKFTIGGDRVNLFPYADNGSMPNTYLATIMPLKKISFGIRLISQTSELELYDRSGYSLGLNKAESSTNIGVTGAYCVTPVVALGISVSHTAMRLLEYEVGTFSVDTGVLYKLHRFNAALTVANLGQQVRFTDQCPLESLPLLSRVGGSYYLLPKKNLLCSAAYEKVWSQKKAGGQSFGIEYYPSKSFALRSGIEWRHNQAVQYYMGVGFSFSHFKLDYAYSSLMHGALDNNISSTSRSGFSYTN